MTKQQRYDYASDERYQILKAKHWNDLTVEEKRELQAKRDLAHGGKRPYVCAVHRQYACADCSQRSTVKTVAVPLSELDAWLSANS